MTANAPPPEWPMVAIIVLNWNNFRDSERCLRSIEGITYPKYRIYLVDNNSQDGSGKRLFEQFECSSTKFIFNEQNLGFAAGCNRGIREALNDGCQYVLLLNNDCIVRDKEFLQHAVSLGESDSRIGIIGGKILFWPDTQKIWSTGGYIRFLSGEVHIGHGESDVGQYDQIAEREFISGALMLVKRNVFDQLGLLPEVYFFGKEEWEISTRAIGANYRLVYEPRFSVCHEASNSHEWTDPTYVYNGALSKILYKRRNLTKYRYIFWFTAYSLYVKYFFRIKYSVQKHRYLKGVPSDMLRAAMRHAIADAPNTRKITEDVLTKFRERLGREQSK